MHHTLRRLCLLALPLAFAACEQVKSANPLSPQIAGPIAGVNVEAPAPVSPANGATIIDTQQPVTLVFLNPPTNSPRPMMLDIQIAVDAGFTQIAFRRRAARRRQQPDKFPAAGPVGLGQSLLLARAR